MQEEIPKVSASTDWDAGLRIHMEYDTAYEPIDMEVVYAQVVSTLQALGMSDKRINEFFGEE